MKSLNGTLLTFDREGSTLLVAERDEVKRLDLARAQHSTLAIADALAIAAFADQIWIVTRDRVLVRVDPSGRALGEPLALPYASAGELIAAPCGPAAATWTSEPLQLLVDEHGAVTARELRGDGALPLGHRRYAAITGHRVVLPSGQAAQFAPTSTIAAGTMLADGKALVLVVACGTARQLTVMSLGTAQIGMQVPVPATAEVRVATGRGLAMVRMTPRLVRAIDLRTGRELGAIALDHDVVDHAIDPDGKQLAVRDGDGEVKLIEVAAVLAARMRPTATLAPIARSVPAAAPAVVPAAPAQRAAHAHTFASRGRYTRGEFRAPPAIDDKLELRSPVTRDVLGVFALGADDIDDAVASARDGLAGWEGLSIDARIAAVARIAPALEQRAGELAAAMQRELGRPAWECQREIAGLVPRLRDVSELARAELAGSVVGASYVRPRALGVLALITPVMLPIATAHAQLIAAIVAGNTVVWKPSSLVAASAQIYIEALHAAGVPAGVVNLVHGTARVGRRLIAHAGVDGVVFAGARDHAREVRRATCDRIDLPVLLHAGAKNIAIVLEGADLAHAASQIATCAMLSSGQRATAIGRVVVAAPLIEPLGEALAREMKRLATTPGFAGPIVSSERFDRYFARIRAAAADGARVVLRPESRPDSLVAGPSIHAAEGADRAALAGYLSDELFGPDLALEPVADLEEALARLRGHPANVAAVFSASDDELARAGRALDAGAVLANHAPIAMSGRLSFAARGMANRGALAVLALTRRAAWVSAGPADVGLPGWATSDDTRAADPPVAAAPAAGGAQ